MRDFRIVLLGLMFISLPARGEDGAAKWSALRQRMQEFVDRGEIAGAVTVVGQRRGIVNLETVGWRDLNERAPMQRETLFRIASMTKPITAIGIMILVDDGKLRIDDPVERHLPEFADPWMVAERLPDRLVLRRPRRPITIKDLLTHTSGLPSGMPVGLADLYRRRDRTLAEAVMAISQRPLEFEPGSRWSYSNAGIDVLGRIIEVASGQRYEDFLQTRLFDPLGMRDTTFYPTLEQTKRLATTYELRDGQLRANPGTLMD
ncbi:MAG: beta-lactamase family protein, partial [Gemmataceae bacterium]|nr:beta-lactamase family protein [Gemmataceae bacterium]